MEINHQLDRLLFENNEKFYPLPPWGRFYISLGQQISSSISKGPRQVIALSIPSRSFCAPLISLGFITDRVDTANQKDHSNYSDYLKSLPKGTPVLLRSEAGIGFKGIYKGCEDRLGEFYFIVQTDTGRRTELNVRLEDSRKIEVLDEQDITLPKNQRGRSISTNSEFTSSLVGKRNAFFLVTYTKLEEVIIGPKKLIEREIKEQRFCINKKDGTLLDILRTREFQNSFAAFRSIVISDRIKSALSHSAISNIPLVIFDGCQSFLKWRDYWRESNWVIILDRTENQYEPAIEQLNREYFQRHVRKSINLSISNIPDGVEIMVFGIKS